MRLSLSSVTYLATNMRDADRREIYNLRNHANAERLAREVVAAATFGKAVVADFEGRPCAIAGITPMWPGVWTIWSFGTDEWRHGYAQIMRWGRKTMKPYLFDRGAHRMQCESRVDHHEAHRWLESIGAVCEGTLKGYGRDGSDYYQYAWTR